MCRMTEEHVRGNRRIWQPGYYLVFDSKLYGEYYMRISRPQLRRFKDLKPKYAVRVKRKHNPQHVMCDA